MENSAVLIPVALSAAAAFGAAVLGSSESTPESKPESTPESAPVAPPESPPVAPPESAPESAPVAPPVAEPVALEEPKQAGGGQTGKVPWGSIYTDESLAKLNMKTVPNDLPDTQPIFSEQTALELRNRLREAQSKLRDTIYDHQTKIPEEYKKILEKYKIANEDFASQNSEYILNDRLASSYASQFNTNLGKEDIDKILVEKGLNPDTQDQAERKKINEERQKLSSVKKANITEDLKNNYKNALQKKETSLFTKEEADIERKRLFEKLTQKRDERKKAFEDEKLLKKEIKEILDKLLKLNTQKPDELPSDFEQRKLRYYRAKDNFDVTENRIKTFFGRYPDENKRDKKTQESLINLRNFAKLELQRATDALTEGVRDQQPIGEVTVKKFISNVVQVLGNRTKTPMYTISKVWWGGKDPNNSINILQALVNILRHKDVLELSNILYEEPDENKIFRHLDRYFKFLESVSGPLMSTKILENYQNAIVTLHSKFVGQANTDKLVDDDTYKKLRNFIMDFIDEQTFLVNNFISSINKAFVMHSDESTSTELIYKLKQLKERQNLVLKPFIIDGKCDEVLDRNTIDLFVNGFGDPRKDILDILNGNDQELKQKLLTEIKFMIIDDYESFTFYKQKYPSLATNDDFKTLGKSIFYTDELEKTEESEGNMPRIAPDTDMGIEEVAIQDKELRLKILKAKLGQIPKNITPGNFLLHEDQPIPISKILDWCEVDGNVTRGARANATIKNVLMKLKDYSPKQTKKTELDFFIETETKSGRINESRVDDIPVYPISSLEGLGFDDNICRAIPMDDFGDCKKFSIVKVRPQPNIIHAFLQVKSNRYSSVPFDSTTVYKGTRVSTRDVYAKLFLEELKKTPPFKELGTTNTDLIRGLCINFKLSVLVLNPIPTKQETIFKNRKLQDEIDELDAQLNKKRTALDSAHRELDDAIAKDPGAGAEKDRHNKNVGTKTKIYNDKKKEYEDIESEHEKLITELSQKQNRNYNFINPTDDDGKTATREEVLVFYKDKYNTYFPVFKFFDESGHVVEEAPKLGKYDGFNRFMGGAVDSNPLKLKSDQQSTLPVPTKTFAQKPSSIPPATTTTIPPAAIPTTTTTTIPPAAIPTTTTTTIPPAAIPTTTTTTIPPAAIPTTTTTTIPPAAIPTTTTTTIPPATTTTTAPPQPGLLIRTPPETTTTTSTTLPPKIWRAKPTTPKPVTSANGVGLSSPGGKRQRTYRTKGKNRTFRQK